MFLHSAALISWKTERRFGPRRRWHISTCSFSNLLPSACIPCPIFLRLWKDDFFFPPVIWQTSGVASLISLIPHLLLKELRSLRQRFFFSCDKKDANSGCCSLLMNNHDYDIIMRSNGGINSGHINNNNMLTNTNNQTTTFITSTTDWPQFFCVF